MKFREENRKTLGGWVGKGGKNIVWTSTWHKEQIEMKRDGKGNLHLVKGKYTLIE